MSSKTRTGTGDLQNDSVVFQYCDRCARRVSALVFDDLTLQDLCQDCFDRLKRRRELVPYPSKPPR
jgi:hypothetical protein